MTPQQKQQLRQRVNAFVVFVDGSDEEEKP